MEIAIDILKLIITLLPYHELHKFITVCKQWDTTISQYLEIDNKKAVNNVRLCLNVIRDVRKAYKNYKIIK